MTSYWILKSEPESYSISQMEMDITTDWNGVRNHQAQNFMKQMKLGDQAFFYHSVTDKCLVGLVEVCGEFQPDPTDETGRFGMVRVKFLRQLQHPVPLSRIKLEPLLSDLLLIRQSRLSVIPLKNEQFALLLKMSEVL